MYCLDRYILDINAELRNISVQWEKCDWHDTGRCKRFKTNRVESLVLTAMIDVIRKLIPRGKTCTAMIDIVGALIRRNLTTMMEILDINLVFHSYCTILMTEVFLHYQRKLEYETWKKSKTAAL